MATNFGNMTESQNMTTHHFFQKSDLLKSATSHINKALNKIKVLNMFDYDTVINRSYFYH